MANIFNNDKIWNRSLDEIMSESFGRYAKYIIQDRALPDIRDGLKPVQRRILYAMNDLNIHFDKAYKKSARTVGEVIGKYHPHGDSSIYEAMVRMSQEWKNNVPLLDMQGNKGSIDGDSPAAMRYTECRLSRYGQLLLDDIKKETVKFIFNFDDSEQEPSILPSLIPNILINGSTGIAAGYATNVPPFNFNEVLEAIIFKIKNKNATLLEIASIIKGPDFPTGGIIQGIDGILDIYKTGKGKFNIRAKFSEVVRNSNKKHKQLIITELPYEVNKATLVKAIDELRVSNKLPGLKEVRDDSDKNGISIMLELDTDKSLDVIKSFLYKNTQLQISYSANIILIKDRKPLQLGILEIIDSYLEHANEIIIKAATFDLNKALLRKEILEGLIIAISKIDLLVNLIKSSNSKDEAKQKLIKTFSINERQAEAVIQLRLYVLTSYDTQKLKDEFNELILFIKGKEDLINNKSVRNTWLINKLNEYRNYFNIKRKTVIEDVIDDIVIEEADIIEEKHGIAIITRDNYIKYINASDFQDIDLEKLKIKENDIPVEILHLSTLQTLVCFTNKGKYVTIPAHKIKFTKQRDNGIHINEIITMDSADKTIAVLAISKTSNVSTELVVATKKSLIKRMTIDEINLSKNAKISSYIHLRQDDEVCSVFIAKKSSKELITITESGFCIRFNIDEIPLVGRVASGVKNINLKNNDLVTASFPINHDESFIYIGSNRGAKRIYFNDIVPSSRAKLGKRVLSQVDSNPYIINSAFMISGRQSLNILEDNGKLNSIKAAEIPISDIFSRMSRYPNAIEIVLFTSLVDLKRNFVEDDLNNNFSTNLDKVKVATNIETKINEYNLDNKIKGESPKETIDTSYKNDSDDSFIKEIEDEINNVKSFDNTDEEETIEDFIEDSIEETNNEKIFNVVEKDEKNNIEENIQEEESVEEVIKESIVEEESIEEVIKDSIVEEESIHNIGIVEDNDTNISISEIAANKEDYQEIEDSLADHISSIDGHPELDESVKEVQEYFSNVDTEQPDYATDDKINENSNIEDNEMKFFNEANDNEIKIEKEAIELVNKNEFDKSDYEIETENKGATFDDILDEFNKRNLSSSFEDIKIEKESDTLQELNENNYNSIEESNISDSKEIDVENEKKNLFNSEYDDFEDDKEDDIFNIIKRITKDD